MGIDPAPFWANLYLHKYESDHITNLMRSDKRCALMYRNASRFIDDECNLNDCGEFGRSFHLIYPSDLHLKCEHNGTHATFLELDISIVDGLFIYKLYDKRDDFPFHIIRMPDKNENIPLHVFYGHKSCQHYLPSSYLYFEWFTISTYSILFVISLTHTHSAQL